MPSVAAYILSASVAAALEDGRPVVALESTIITHSGYGRGSGSVAAC